MAEEQYDYSRRAKQTLTMRTDKNGNGGFTPQAKLPTATWTSEKKAGRTEGKKEQDFEDDDEDETSTKSLVYWSMIAVCGLVVAMGLAKLSPI